MVEVMGSQNPPKQTPTQDAKTNIVNMPLPRQFFREMEVMGYIFSRRGVKNNNNTWCHGNSDASQRTTINIKFSKNLVSPKGTLERLCG